MLEYSSSAGLPSVQTTRLRNRSRRTRGKHPRYHCDPGMANRPATPDQRCGEPPAFNKALLTAVNDRWDEQRHRGAQVRLPCQPGQIGNGRPLATFVPRQPDYTTGGLRARLNAKPKSNPSNARRTVLPCDSAAVQKKESGPRPVTVAQYPFCLRTHWLLPWPGTGTYDGRHARRGRIRLSAAHVHPRE